MKIRRDEDKEKAIPKATDKRGLAMDGATTQMRRTLSRTSTELESPDEMAES